MRADRRDGAAVAGLLAGLLALTPAAWSYFSTGGTGTGAASVATLSPPSGVSASSSGDSVAVTWTGPAAPGGGAVDGYYVQRSQGTAGGSCASSPSSLLAASASSCTDSGVATGTFTYNVVAVYRSWRSGAASGPVDVSPAVVDHLEVSAPASATAGTAFTVTVTARDTSGATVPAHAGTRAIVWSGGSVAANGSTPSWPASVDFTSGVGTASIILVRAETATLTATDGAVSGTSAGITVAPAAATRFVLAAGSAQVAGTAFAVGVTAQDPFENTATGYTGEKALTWSGPAGSPSGAAPTYPSSVTFGGGLGSAPVALAKAETVTLTAEQGAVSGTSGPIAVSAGAASRLAWSGVVLSKGTLVSPCAFTCTGTGVDNFGLFTARVAVTDALGNTVSDLGVGYGVKVTTPASGAGSGGSFTAPVPGTSADLGIAPSGPALSTTTFTFKAGNGNWTSNTFTAATATGTVFSPAAGNVTK